jgi:hypothetical protein
LCAANAGDAMLTATITAPKISLAIFAMIFRPLRVLHPRTEDWIALPRIPSRILEVLWRLRPVIRVAE